MVPMTGMVAAQPAAGRSEAERCIIHDLDSAGIGAFAAPHRFLAVHPLLL
jgi:hypothetical protein